MYNFLALIDFGDQGSRFLAVANHDKDWLPFEEHEELCDPLNTNN